MVFSWVCHYWRSVILNEASFWKTVVIRRRGISPIFLEELFTRSRNNPLEIIIQHDSKELLELYARNRRYFLPVIDRVKTFHLYVYRDKIYLTDDIRFLWAFLSFFPSLENIFCRPISRCPTDVDFIPLSIQPQLKAMQVYIDRLDNIAAPGQFRELRWLRLTYTTRSISLFTLLKTLQNLPNLQVLHLFPSAKKYSNLKRDKDHDEDVITLNELTALISSCPILHLIDAPKLSHLNVLTTYFSIGDTYGHLCGFDFSRITHIRSEIIRGSVHPYIIGNPTYEWEGFNDTSWSSSGQYRYNGNLAWVYDEFPISYPPNQFRLSFRERRAERSPALISTFVLYLKKATNLEEITFTGLDLSSLNSADVDSLSNALRWATSVRTLTILWGNSLKDLCDFLRDKDVLPRLKKLRYSADFYEAHMDHSYIPNCLRNLVKERSEGPLEIELSNFDSIHPRGLEQIENSGLQVIQRKDKICITTVPEKKSELTEI
ncbi:hypothetical protein Clacol_008725 [Clathrus columnatus]|uniref:F-box domain-containing protein n=1 Tax=Clathrus columnatus TaxID=1419009 RepID=A0AAV5AII9_9AGAM|nr:hypothetical protein Clacol_008725 [Clathrus columnatus]